MIKFHTLEYQTNLKKFFIFSDFNINIHFSKCTYNFKTSFTSDTGIYWF